VTEVIGVKVLMQAPVREESGSQARLPWLKG